MRCVITAPLGLAVVGFALAITGCEVDASGLATDLFAPLEDGGTSATNEGARDASSGASSTPTPPSTPVADATAPPAVPPDAAPVDAGTDAGDLPDVVLTADAPVGPVDPCDLDEDGFRANSAACGGPDCCDDDGRAYPGETAYFTTLNACGSFDYDCDGISAMEFGVAQCQISGFSCAGDGFQTVTACGATATFETCSEPFTCGGVGADKTQACR